MKLITLKTKEELDIYMSPTRQQLMRQLSLASAPMTPKQLSDKLSISPSSVQHHIKKLSLLGLIELDHTEMINGIKASYYKPALVTVQIGLSQADGLFEQRQVLVQDSIARIYEGFRSQMNKRIGKMGRDQISELQKWGDILTGVAHLEKEQSNNLMKLISEFLEEHTNPSPQSSPWEYAIIAYNAEEMKE